jgi:hypothetical protein
MILIEAGCPVLDMNEFDRLKKDLLSNSPGLKTKPRWQARWR